VWWTAPSPDGTLLAVQTWASDSADNRVDVVRIATGQVLQSHTVAHGPNGVAFTPDGRELIALGCCWTGSGSALLGWDARAGRQLFSLGDGTGAEAFDVAPNRDVVDVGTAGGKFLQLDASSGKPVSAPLQVAAGEISQMSLSPDGRSLVVSSDDHTASIWDLRSRSRLGDAFGPYQGTVPAVAFEPDGRVLIDLLSNAVQWPTDVRTWERFACRAAGRGLTRAEWHDLLPDRSYQRVCTA